MKSVGGKNGLNLFHDMKPPKDVFIEVIIFFPTSLSWKHNLLIVLKLLLLLLL